MKTIIGLDLGNCYSFPCYIANGDVRSDRLAGNPIDLLPADRHYGYPSVFFYSQQAAEQAIRRNLNPPPWYCEEAVSARATPTVNRITNLKLKLTQTYRLDDLEGSYDDAIVGLIQHVIRKANKILKQNTGETSNEVALAYPVRFMRSTCEYLKNLAEKATLEDGTPIKIVGMITEPAAAALNYLSEKGQQVDTTVMVYDLGGGTLDLAVVSLYPGGRRDPNNRLYYYDIEDQGYRNIGGTQFDERMKELIYRKVPEGQIVSPNEIAIAAVEAKHALSYDTYTEFSLMALKDSKHPGEYIHIEISREEFEACTQDILMDTVAAAKDIMYNSKLKNKPDIIVLTGGSCLMPMVENALRKAFPEYAARDAICIYKPSRAVAHGTARYGLDCDYRGADGGVVLQKTLRDIGIEYVDGATGRNFVEVLLPAGTPLPFESHWDSSFTRYEGSTSSVFPVMEAHTGTPDITKPRTDFVNILNVTLSYKPCPANTEHHLKLVLDNDGLLSVIARNAKDPNINVEGHCTLKSIG